MPFYDFTKDDEEITIEKLLENYKFLEYISSKKFKERPSVETADERRHYRKAVAFLESAIKRAKHKNEN